MKQLFSNRSNDVKSIGYFIRGELRCTVNPRDIHKGSNEMEATAPYHRESFDRSRSSIQDIFVRSCSHMEDR